MDGGVLDILTGGGGGGEGSPVCRRSGQEGRLDYLCFTFLQFNKFLHQIWQSKQILGSQLCDSDSHIANGITYFFHGMLL